MKRFIFLFLLSCIFKTGYSQSPLSKQILGTWKSTEPPNIIFEFTPTFEKKYHIKKGVKVVPPFNIERANYSINDKLLYEHQGGGGGIDLYLQCEIYNDTLKTVYHHQIRLYKRINNSNFKLLVGKK